MNDNKTALREHAIRVLDARAREHPKRHQNVHARRYLVSGRNGDAEVVIIVKEGTYLQIWVEASAVDAANAHMLGLTFRPGAETYSAANAEVKVRYGRHSSLKVLDRLHRGDAWHGKPATPGEFDQILRSVTGAS